MTTTSQQTVLTDDETACLHELAKGIAKPAGTPEVTALQAKGMVEMQADGCRLTPAGMHAINVSAPGNVPGIDS